MSVQRMLYGLSVLMCCLFLAGPARAEEGEQASWAAFEDLARRSAAVKGIVSNFTQTRTLSFMNECLIAQGSFSFHRPDSLIWRYSAPAPFVLEYDKGQARFRSGNDGKGAAPAAADARESALAAAIARQIMIWMSLDKARISEAYHVALESEQPLVFRMTPKKKHPVFGIADMRVTFVGRGPDVERIVLNEEDGDSIRLDFFDTRHTE